MVLRNRSTLRVNLANERLKGAGIDRWKDLQLPMTRSSRLAKDESPVIPPR